MHTIISNRWGIKVFESNNLAIEWNGRDIPDGFYFWIVNYIDANGVDDTLNGFVTIIR